MKHTNENKIDISIYLQKNVLPMDVNTSMVAGIASNGAAMTEFAGQFLKLHSTYLDYFKWINKLI